MVIVVDGILVCRENIEKKHASAVCTSYVNLCARCMLPYGEFTLLPATYYHHKTHRRTESSISLEMIHHLFSIYCLNTTRRFDTQNMRTPNKTSRISSKKSRLPRCFFPSKSASVDSRAADTADTGCENWPCKGGVHGVVGYVFFPDFRIRTNQDELRS